MANGTECRECPVAGCVDMFEEYKRVLELLDKHKQYVARMQAVLNDFPATGEDWQHVITEVVALMFEEYGLARDQLEGLNAGYLELLDKHKQYVARMQALADDFPAGPWRSGRSGMKEA